MFNLKYLRGYEDYSMMQIAKKLNVSKSTYASWEWGVAVIPLKHLINLANIYKINIDFILGLSENKKFIKEICKLDKKFIANNLKNFRLEKGLTQQAIISNLHISRSTLSDYERGKVLISTSFLYDLCKKYQISSDYILGLSNLKELIN